VRAAAVRWHPGAMTPTVRTLDGDDWAAWREIRLRSLREDPSAFGSTYEREVAFDENFWRERLDDPGATSVLAYAGGVPVGLGGAFPDRPGLLHVVAMWVEPGSRGLGVGTAVLHRIEAEATARGLGLHLDVHTGNPAARRLYERYGFVATGETEPLREGSAELVERMVLQRPVSGRPGSR
jgi:GNAT superfamily N-acetyltransferase